MLGAGRRDLFQILGVSVAFLFLLRNGHRHVAAIFHFVPQSLESRLKSRHPHRRRPHIDAAARLSQIQRHANHTNLLGRDVGGADRCLHKILVNCEI